MPWHYTCDPSPNALAGIDAPARQCVDHMLDMRCADELTGPVDLITSFAKLLNHWNGHLAFLGSAPLPWLKCRLALLTKSHLARDGTLTVFHLFLKLFRHEL